MALPAAFEQRMQRLLGEEYPAFRDALARPQARGLRVSPLKIAPEQFAAQAPFTLTPVPWAPEGFFYPDTQRPGRHPYYEAGVYYIQEPSAMAVGALADAKPGERVLDLCAAPGGKTTHLAGRMHGEGLLVANEIHAGRAAILAQSIERMGVQNCIVCNETPERLAQRFPEFFDCIVVDAPCSGEGMFRKDDNPAQSEWTPELPSFCAARQAEILDRAADMLAGGGRLIYSTCTFAPEEDEGTLSRFLERHPEFSVQQGQLVIELNERILPRLSVNAEYAALMNTSDDPEVQRYVKEKLSEAQALIKGVHTRCDTLVQMLTLIGREQHGFFCGGEALLPVTMQQLSEKMGVSTSTVSRAAQNKYIQFQGRIIPVRSFFTTALRPDAAVSSHAVKQRLQSLLRAEDPAAPLSDEALRLTLSALGIEVSRRAIAKYRAEMDIPSSSQRKKR